MLDYSSSINPEEHVLAINFTAEVINNFDVGPDFVRVGFVQFSDDPQHEFYLNTYNKNEDVVKHVLGLEYRGGDTYIGEALRFVKDYFTASRGSRPGIPKTLVLISDGDSHDDVDLDAQELRNLGIEILVIAVGDVWDLQLLQITGDPQKLFTVRNFNNLAKIKKEVSDAICKTPHIEPAGKVSLLSLSAPTLFICLRLKRVKKCSLSCRLQHWHRHRIRYFWIQSRGGAAQHARGAPGGGRPLCF